jgi:hypothetical protein
LDEECEGWYRRLAVSEVRMDKLLATYEKIRNCLK